MAGHATVSSKESVRPDSTIEIGDESKEIEEEDEEIVAARFRRLQAEPTREEIEEHNIDHARFRSWCPHCVRGRAKSFPHRHDKGKKIREVPKISIDYGFIDDSKDKNEEEKGMPILVIKDSETGMRFARVVPKKGVDPYAVHVLTEDLKILGYS